MAVMGIYKRLMKQHGPQGWWPCRTGKKFEVCIGAILTQNTNWNNVEKALDNMIKADCISAEKIAAMGTRKLQSLIRPSGFYRQKARRLKEFSNFILGFGTLDNFLRKVTREELLNVKGIGPETADSILLYACGKPYFVVDAYTRRMFLSLGIIESEGYEQIRGFFEARLPRNAELYREFHALIVRHAKECCRGFLGGACILNRLKQADYKQPDRIARK